MAGLSTPAMISNKPAMISNKPAMISNKPAMLDTKTLLEANAKIEQQIKELRNATTQRRQNSRNHNQPNPNAKLSRQTRQPKRTRTSQRMATQNRMAKQHKNPIHRHLFRIPNLHT